MDTKKYIKIIILGTLLILLSVTQYLCLRYVVVNPEHAPAFFLATLLIIIFLLVYMRYK